MMASGAGSAVTGASTQIVVFQGATTSTSLAIAVPGLNAAEDEATAKAIEAKMRSENTKKNYKYNCVYYIMPTIFDYPAKCRAVPRGTAWYPGGTTE